MKQLTLCLLLLTGCDISEEDKAFLGERPEVTVPDTATGTVLDTYHGDSNHWAVVVNEKGLRRPASFGLGQCVVAGDKVRVAPAGPGLAVIEILPKETEGGL